MSQRKENLSSGQAEERCSDVSLEPKSLMPAWVPSQDPISVKKKNIVEENGKMSFLILVGFHLKFQQTVGIDPEGLKLEYYRILPSV